jgi:photosystem II stability/assembly factor-like uncharacterized protein
MSPGRLFHLLMLPVLALALPARAEGRWTWQNNPPPILTKVHFLNGQKGWALGVLGTVARTTNGGTTWTGTSIHLSASDLLSIFFVNETTGWIAGEDGVLFKSTDGGTTWSPQNSGKTGPLNQVYFINPDTGWIAGSNFILRTFNGGATWTASTSTPATNASFFAVHFNADGTGWAAGSSLRKSVDFGVTWSAVNALPTGSFQRWISFANADTGWSAGDDGTILKSTNAGETWTLEASGTDEEIIALRVLGTQGAVAIDTRGDVLKTTNGGINWTKTHSSDAFNVRTAAAVWNADTAWAVDEVGAVFRTTNGGTSWPLQSEARCDLQCDLQSVFFADTSTGWAAGDSGVIVKTTNGGAVWARQPSGVKTFFKAVHFPHPDTGWVVGRTGTILKSLNGGATWTAQTSGTTQDLAGAHFLNGGLGWAVGGGGTILKTTNGGAVWTSQSQGTLTLNVVRFLDASRGWAAGNSGRIYKTTNGGTNWSQQTSGVTAGLSGMHFLDTLNGWVSGTGVLLKTTDGGANWTEVAASGSRYVRFLDYRNGWAGDKTTDGGQTWVTQPTLPVGSSGGFATTNPVGGDAFFVDINHGWAVGFRGSILRYRDNAPPSSPVPATPAHNAPNIALSPSLLWRASSSATAYRVQLSTDSTFATTGLDDSTLTGTTRSGGTLNAGTTYYWRVRARNAFGSGAWSEVVKFTTVPTVPPAPVLVTPAANATGVALSGNLSWNASAGAATYRVQLATDSTFAATLINDSTVTALTRATGTLANNTAYFWRVNAKNAGGTSAWSEVRKFTTALPAAPAAPTLASPANGAVGLNATPTLTWNAVAGAATYRVQLATDSLFSALVWNDSTVTTASRATPSLALGTPYYWRVNAKNAGGTSAYSPIWRFSTVPVALAPHDFTFRHTGLSGGRAFQFGLPHRAHVKIVLFDAKGGTVRKLLDEERGAGYHTLPLSPEALKGSYYLLDFRAGDYRKTFKVRL